MPEDDVQEEEKQETEMPENTENAPENNPGEIEAEPPKNPPIAFGPKKLIAMLLKKKMLLIGVGVAVGVVGVLAILVALIESSSSNDYFYKEGACKTVTVTYDPYDESQGSSVQSMDIETYVKSALAAYAKDLNDPQSGVLEVYRALAITLRTEAVANNCEVTYRDKILDPNVNVDNNIEDALDFSKSLVLGDDDGDYIAAKVSDFCWYSNENNVFEFYQGTGTPVDSDFVSTYLNNNIYETCPCNNPQGDPFSEEDDGYNQCWVTWDTDDDGIDDEAAWLHEDEETGFSVFGAYYLMERFGYHYNQIINYFFGSHVQYMTIEEKTKAQADISNNGATCSEFSITNTTLSRPEFISKMEAYSYSSSNSNRNAAWHEFVKNAGKIYDMGVNNNINPELIVVRAIREGFSPGGASHNYFGISCYNNQPESCKSYSSFDEGIMGFISTMKGYFSFTDMMQRYAYLGDYWYNPGSSSNGGCYYAEYIYPNGLDEYVQTACGASYAGCSGSSCMATRQEDHDAYAAYQGRGMIETRYNIFGISADNCSNNNMNYGSCVLYNQADSRWGNLNLGYSNDTIAHSGCALTSVAIALTCTGQMDTSSFSPAILNQALINNNGYSGEAIYWDNGAIREFVSTFNMEQYYKFPKSMATSEKIKYLQGGLSNSRIAIVHIENSEHTRGHYVVLQSVNTTNNTFTCLDPGGGLISTYSIDDVDRVIYYTY